MTGPTNRWLVPCLILLAVACRDKSSDPAEIVVARIDSQALSLTELQTYFDANLLADEAAGELSSVELDRVKSRLFDAFVDERVLMAEAEKRGRQPSQLEAEAYAHEPPTDSEIREYIEKHRERLRPRRELELTSLMLATMEQAETVYNQIRRRRMTFNEAVARYEANPGQTLPMRVAWDSLTEDLRQALDGLKPGRVTRPVEVHGEAYLFRLESLPREVATTEDASLMDWAARELEADRRRMAFDDMLVELRARSRVRLNLRNLPFRYVPQDE